MGEIILPSQIKESDNIPLDVIAEMLNVDVEDLYDLSLEDISKLTIAYSEQKVEVINKILEKRNEAHTTVIEAQKEYGITKGDLSFMFFEELKGAATK